MPSCLTFYKARLLLACGHRLANRLTFGLRSSTRLEATAYIHTCSHRMAWPDMQFSGANADRGDCQDETPHVLRTGAKVAHKK